MYVMLVGGNQNGTLRGSFHDVHIGSRYNETAFNFHPTNAGKAAGGRVVIYFEVHYEIHIWAVFNELDDF